MHRFWLHTASITWKRRGRRERRGINIESGDDGCHLLKLLETLTDVQCKIYQDTVSSPLWGESMCVMALHMWDITVCCTCKGVNASCV